MRNRAVLPGNTPGRVHLANISAGGFASGEPMELAVRSAEDVYFLFAR
jgi:hypothetical protein